MELRYANMPTSSLCPWLTRSHGFFDAVVSCETPAGSWKSLFLLSLSPSSSLVLSLSLPLFSTQRKNFWKCQR